MKYAVIGAGGMGIQYGVLLQEFAHKDVDFVDTWKPNVEKIREQGGAYVSQDGEDRHLVPINVLPGGIRRPARRVDRVPQADAA